MSDRRRWPAPSLFSCSEMTVGGSCFGSPISTTALMFWIAMVIMQSPSRHWAASSHTSTVGLKDSGSWAAPAQRCSESRRRSASGPAGSCCCSCRPGPARMRPGTPCSPCQLRREPSRMLSLWCCSMNGIRWC